MSTHGGPCVEPYVRAVVHRPYGEGGGGGLGGGDGGGGGEGGGDGGGGGEGGDGGGQRVGHFALHAACPSSNVLVP